MIEGTPSVRIKGVGDSIWVTIVPDTPMEFIKTELERLFDPLKHMADTTRVVVDTGAGRENSDYHRNICAYLKEKFDLKDIISAQDRTSEEKNQFKMKNPRNSISQNHRDTLVLAGRVRSGQSIQAKKHLVIMGDVNPGCELTAGGDILVIGTLSGTAAAGQPHNTDAIILALDFQPTQIKIGEVVAAGLPSTGQKTPEYAHIENGGIVVDDYLATNPFKRMPWPVVR
jgi:septum site-determining protein MinC